MHCNATRTTRASAETTRRCRAGFIWPSGKVDGADGNPFIDPSVHDLCSESPSAGIFDAMEVERLLAAVGLSNLY